MKRIKIFILASGLALTGIILTYFINHKDETDTKGFAVVELFTSEGCSSCPPADALVAKIQNENKDKQVYILAFHVDYWNRLGWKDVFSSPNYSKRQNEYARWLNLQSVYTPQIVVNGKKEFVGSEEGTLRNAIIGGLRATPSATLVLNAQKENGQLSVSYRASGVEKNTNLLLALVQKNAQTKVERGENAGHTLSHVQIVRKIQSEPISAGSNGNVVIALPDGFNDQDYELIGFVQNKTNGIILAAAKTNLGTTVNAGK